MKPGTLYLCPTPLGNLEDITLRAIRILREADRIAAEDTRRTRKLLNHLAIRKPLTSYHEHNKSSKTPVILTWLLDGLSVALVSDAGTPGIADPGEDLVRDAIRHGVPVRPLPGAVAAVTALVASGLMTVPFTFYGFLPPRGTKKHEILSRLLEEDRTVIFYEAPHRLQKTLASLAETDPKRQVVVAREMTKVHEEFIRGTLTEVSAYFQTGEPKGEITVLIAGSEEKQDGKENPLEVALRFMREGMSTKEAAREASRCTGISRNKIYKKLLDNKK